MTFEFPQVADPGAEVNVGVVVADTVITAEPVFPVPAKPVASVTETIL